MPMYKANGYDILMDVSARSLGMLGPTEILYSMDTYQFNNYSRYDTEAIDEARKAEVHGKQFPVDLQNAYELGKRLVRNARADR